MSSKTESDRTDTEARDQDGLIESIRQLNEAQRLAGLGSWSLDLRTNRLEWSEEIYRMFEIDPQRFGASYEAFLETVHPDDRTRVHQAYAESLKNRTPYDIIHRLQFPDGRVKYVQERCETEYDDAGLPVRSTGTVQDITLQRRAELDMQETADHLQAILDHVADGIVTINADGIVQSFNRGAERIFEYRSRQVVGQPFVSLVSVTSRVAFQEYLGHFKTDWMAATLRLNRLEIEGVRQDGSSVQMDVAISRITFRDEFRYIVLLRDISERLRNEESMRLAATIYKNSKEAMLITDEHNRIVDANPAFTQQSGYRLTEVLGKNPRILQSGRHDKAFYKDMWQTLMDKGHWQGELWDRRKNGSLHVKLANISVIRKPDGQVHRYVAQFFDITESKENAELIWKQANFDMITGLPNRNLMHDRLGQEIKKAARTRLPLALLFIDLDHFKEINDTLGHAKGDILLHEAARRIKGCVRESDTVARIGGDEFTVILPQYGDRNDIERIAYHIIQSLSEPFDLGDGQAGYISASIGITLYPEDATTIEALLKNADQAMYRAKAEGRNCLSYFTESMQHEAAEKLALTHDLRTALSRNELELFFQPILNLRSGQIEKAEALLRWHHPQRGMVSPALFIPLAEGSGLINEIGEWVFQEAVSAAGRWHKRFGRLIQISVNKSPLQFSRPERQQWKEDIERLGLPAQALAVEITEGLLLSNSPKVRDRLIEYSLMGVQLSIDDFGTGYSALSYLKEFDVDYLKIDRTFVSSLESGGSGQVLTEAIIVMAHKLGIQTIAEGVETAQQFELLKSFGCDYVQGFYCAPPVPEQEFLALLNEKGLDVQKTH
ncbi:MAG: EAL domain-containing protein [Betaproteobacteria bacterium]|nr:EAL domain-containing protein [Betaproteobacteria bacterium]